MSTQEIQEELSKAIEDCETAWQFEPVGQLTPEAIRYIHEYCDTETRDRVKNCARMLIAEGHVSDYQGLWRDISSAIRQVWNLESAIAEIESKAEEKIAELRAAIRKSIGKINQETDLSQFDGEALVEAKQMLREQAEKAAKRKATKERAKQYELMSVEEIFDGSDGTATRWLHRRLDKLGGTIAKLCLLAQKSSERAKKYGRSKYRDMSYDRKGEGLEQLCAELSKQDQIRWGWGVDGNGPHCNVLYVDLPVGQVSWHSSDRYEGPDYPDEWDGLRASHDRVIEYAHCVLHPEDLPIRVAAYQEKLRKRAEAKREQEERKARLEVMLAETEGYSDDHCLLRGYTAEELIGNLKKFSLVEQYFLESDRDELAKQLRLKTSVKKMIESRPDLSVEEIEKITEENRKLQVAAYAVFDAEMEEHRLYWREVCEARGILSEMMHRSSIYADYYGA